MHKSPLWKILLLRKVLLNEWMEVILWKTGLCLDRRLDQKLTFFIHSCQSFHVQTNVTFSRSHHFCLLWPINRAVLVKVLAISVSIPLVPSCFIQFKLVSCMQSIMGCRNNRDMPAVTLQWCKCFWQEEKKQLLPFSFIHIHSRSTLIDGLKPWNPRSDANIWIE